MNILGTDYELVIDPNIKNEGADGLCQPYSKRILIRPLNEMLDVTDTYEDKKKGYDMTLRHEIFHAFFFESGDMECGGEKLVEWLAAQFPKILKVFQEYNCTGLEELDNGTET